MFLQSLLTSLLLTWPQVLHPGQAALGSPHGDNFKHLWNLWVTQKTWAALESGLLHNPFINYPEGVELWPIEPLHSLVAVAFSGVSLILLSNLLVVVNLTLDGLTAALLVREVSGSRLAACVGALLLQGSSFALFAVEVGVGELQHLWLLPLAFWCLLRLVRSSWPGWIPITAGILGITPLACFYHGIFVAIGCTVLALFALARSKEWRPLLGRLGLVALAALVVASIPIKAFSSSYGDLPEKPESVLEQVFYGGPDTANPPETRLRLVELVAGGHASRSTNEKDHAYGGGRLLGIPLVILVLFASWQDPKKMLPWLVVSAVALVLAMGPHPTTAGSQNTLLSSNDVALPFHYLNRFLSLYNLEIHFPARFMALAQVALVVVASSAVATVSGRAAILAAILAGVNVIDVCTRGVVRHPLSTTQVPDMSDLDVLGEHKGHALLDLTYLWLDNLQNRHTALAAQMHHQHPVNTVALERIDRFDRRGLERTCALRLPHKLHAEFVGLSNLAFAGFDFSADYYMLQQWGFQEIMIGLPAGTVPDSLTRSIGQASVLTDDLMIWKLPQVEASDSQAAAWTEEYERRLVHVRKNGCPFERTTPPSNAE